MPRSAEQVEKIREERRDEILSSALEAFARHGYEGTSVRMIARSAGISQGLLYNYFDGKLDLLRTLFARGLERVESSFGAAAGGATPQERISRLVGSAFEIVSGDRLFWQLSYQLRMQPQVMEEIGGDILAWAEAIRERIEGLLREAGVAEADVEARALFAAIDGAAQHYVLDPAGYPLDAVAAALVRRFTGAGGA